MRGRSAPKTAHTLLTRLDVGFEAVGAVLGVRSLRLGRVALTRLVVHKTVRDEWRVCHVHVVLLLLVHLGSRSSRGEGEVGVVVLVKRVDRAEKVCGEESLRTENVSGTDRSHLCKGGVGPWQRECSERES